MLAVLSALAVMGVLAGCAQIPTSGPVERGDQVQDTNDEPAVRVLPRGPVAGQSPIEVVKGFLDASASFEDDHAVARRFMTARASDAWNPNAGVTVIDDNPRRRFVADGNRVQLFAQQTARIAADGAYTPRGGVDISRTFQVKKDGDSWRISRAPQGLLLDRIEVSLAFRAYNIYFMNPQREGARSFLVADPVYLPVVQSGAATALVQTLLNGPTRWLAPAVESLIPNGTKLVVESVPVTNGVAQVDLSSQFLEAQGEALQMAAAQITSTLLELSSSVTAVQITVEGQPLPVSSAPSEFTADTWQEYEPDTLRPVLGALFVRNGIVHTLNEDASAPLEGALGEGQYSVIEPSQSWGGDVVTALSADRTQLLLSRPFGDPGVTIARTGNRLLPMTIDGSNRMWSLDVGSRRPALSVNEKGRWREAALRTPPGTISSFQVSADGTRVAIVIHQKREDGRGKLMLGRVVEGPDRLRVEAFRPVEPTLRDVTDASWADATTLAVLGTRSGGPTEPLLVDLDRTVTPATNDLLVDATSVVGAPGLPLLADTKGDGGISRAGSSGWAPVVKGHDPAYPG